MKKIVFVTPKDYPVPAVKGGAVETLLTNLIRENEKEKKARFYMLSIYNEEAKKISDDYEKTEIIYIKMKLQYIFENLKNRLDVDYYNKENHCIIVKMVYQLFRNFLRAGRRICNQVYNYKAFKKIGKLDFDYIIIEAGDIERYKSYIRKIPKEKCILHLHGEVEANKNNTIYYSNFLAISKFVKQKFLEGNLIREQQIKILPNAIKKQFGRILNDEEKRKIKKKYNIKEKNVIIFCGRIVQEKGVKELVKAFKKIKYIDDTRLIIVGNSGFGNNVTTPYEKEIEKEIESIKDKVSFLGYINNKQMPELYGISDIAVFPSLWEEGFGLVILEAMSSYLPIITTNSGAIPEIVNDKCSIILERNEQLVNNIANSIEQLIKNPSKRKSMGIEGNKISKNYTSDIYYKNFIEIMENIDK